MAGEKAEAAQLKGQWEEMRKSDFCTGDPQRTETLLSLLFMMAPFHTGWGL